MKYALSLLTIASALVVMPVAAFGQQAPAAQAPVPRKRFSMYADLGFAHRRLYGAPIVGGELEIGIGGTGQTLGAYGTVGIAIGKTDQGLTTMRFALGTNLLFPVSERLRLGLEPRLTLLSIARATQGGAMGGGGFGLYGNAMFDLAKFDPGALYASARLGVEPYPGSTPTAVVWGGTLSLGYRY